jgi:pyridoxine 5-phosphate synthase
MILLGVNIDHSATLRQARYKDARRPGGSVEPDPVARRGAERAGADGITAHLREDRRHIQDRDIWRLRESVDRLNFEMACTKAMVDLALKLKPLGLRRPGEEDRGHDRGGPRRRGWQGRG